MKEIYILIYGKGIFAVVVHLFSKQDLLVSLVLGLQILKPCRAFDL